MYSLFNRCNPRNLKTDFTNTSWNLYFNIVSRKRLKKRKENGTYYYQNYQRKVKYNSHPISITHMENIFSALVFGETLPNPTLVKLLNVKYNAVTYLALVLGPPFELLYSWWVAFARWSSHPILGFKYGLSALPIAYQMQANQCAINANAATNNNNTAAPYSEYLSIFRATRTSRSNLAVFSNPMRVVVWNISKGRYR